MKVSQKPPVSSAQSADKPGESPSKVTSVPSVKTKAPVSVRTRLFTDEEWAERRQQIIDELYLMADDAKNALAGLLQAQDERVRRETALDILGFASIQLRAVGALGTGAPGSGAMVPMAVIPEVGKAMSGLVDMLFKGAKNADPDFELRNVHEQEAPESVKPASGGNGHSGLRPELLGARTHDY